MNDKIILHYFPLNARGVLIRAILHLSGANWENNVIQFQDWPALKGSGKLENQQLPALEYNGKLLSQSLAIELFLAKKFGFSGSNDEEDYEIVNLLSTRDDVFKVVSKVLRPQSEEDQKNLEANKKALLETSLPLFLKIYENRVTNKKGKYLFGDKLTLGDLFLGLFANILFKNKSRVSEFGSVLTTHAPNLEKFADSLFENELKTFVEKYYFSDSFI